MNIIFLTIVRIVNIEEKGVYQDLIRKFRDEGHNVYIVCPCERKLGKKTHVQEIHGVHILNVRTLNLLRTNIIEKGIGMLLLESQFKSAIKKYFKGIEFDLITYSTPPITLTNVVKFLKKQNPRALSYLQLKDIFPQNAVDIGLFSNSSIFYNYFRKKEVELYKYSDFIGCMSPANVEFILKHNPEIEPNRVEVAPNSFDIKKTNKADFMAVGSYSKVRNKYGLPQNKPILIYGGSLGKPQGIPFLIKCLNANANREDCHFLVIGTGTELPKLKEWYKKSKPKAVTVMDGLPKDDYNLLVSACDVGLIFLDHRFTIPNYPSRILSYMENRMPVLCVTDPSTDIGRIAEENGYGYWCESLNPNDFTALVDKVLAADRKAMGERGYEFLKNNYLVEHTYNAIMRHFE